MGGKVRALQLRLATLLSLMKRIDEPKVTSWIGSKVNFALLRSCHVYKVHNKLQITHVNK